MANQDEIEFECPRCLKNVKAPSHRAGERIDCPSCQASLLVPAAGVPRDAFDDIFESDSAPLKQAPSKPPEPKANSESNRSTYESDILANESDILANELDPFAEDRPSETDNSIDEDVDDDVLAGIEIPTIDADDDNPLADDDPFEVKEDASLKVDGIGDLFKHADVYGIKCKVCDTRIHVRPDQAGQHVACPECYSEILVTPPQANPKPAQRWVQEGRDKTAKKDDELKLSDPVKRPPVEIDPSYGLSAPEADLLAPKPVASAEVAAGDSEIRMAGEVERESKRRTQPKASAVPSPQKSKQNLSRRELYAESQRRQNALDAGQAYRPEQETAVGAKKDFPEFNFGSLLTSAIEMLKSPGVGLRTVIALALMCLGAIWMQWFATGNAPQPEAGQAGQTAMQVVLGYVGWFAGGVPYLLGLAVLWYASSYVYRDAALGRLEVKSWKVRGRAELLGTFLIFAFGFFIGGLPVFFLLEVMLPMQVLFGPLLLLGAWYSQSPFSIVNVDAFQIVGELKAQWIEFYKFMFALAAAGFVTSGVFSLRWLISSDLFILNAVVTMVGILMTVVITLLFAAVCGWHCGKVVNELENQPSL